MSMLEIRITPETITLSYDGSDLSVKNETPDNNWQALNQALLLINDGVEAVVYTDCEKFVAELNELSAVAGRLIRALWSADPIAVCTAVHVSGLREEGGPRPGELIWDDRFAAKLVATMDHPLALVLKYHERFGLRGVIINLL